MDVSIANKLNHINEDLSHIENISSDKDSNTIDRLVKGIISELNDLQSFDFEKIDESERHIALKHLDETSEKINSLVNDGFILPEQKNPLIENIGQAKLKIQGLSMADIPDELLIRIFQNLNPNQLQMIVNAASEKLKRVAYDQTLFKSKLTLEENVSRAFKKWRNNETSLTFYDKDILQKNVKLDLRDIDLTKEFCEELSSVCSNLEIIGIRSLPDIDILLPLSKSLKHILIRDFEKLDLNRLKALKKLEKLETVNEVNLDDLIREEEANNERTELTAQVDVANWALRHLSDSIQWFFGS